MHWGHIRTVASASVLFMSPQHRHGACGTAGATADPPGRGSAEIASSGGAIDRQACSQAAVVLAVAPESTALRVRKCLYVVSYTSARFAAADTLILPW